MSPRRTPQFYVVAFDYEQNDTWGPLARLRDTAGALHAALATRLRVNADGPTAVFSDLDSAKGLVRDGLADAHHDDIVVVYIGGHGHGTSEPFYLVGPAAGRALDPDSGITAEHLAAWVDGSRSPAVVVVIDACYATSGASELVRAIDRLAKGAGTREPTQQVFVIAGAPLNEEVRDGEFIDTLMDVLWAGEVRDELMTALWTRRTEYIDAGVLTRALRRRLPGVRSRLIESGPLLAFPNLGARPQSDVTLSAKSLLDGDEDNSEDASLLDGALEIGDDRWYFTGRRAAIQSVSSWLEYAQQGLLAIVGSPGCGKSALLAHLLDRSTNARPFTSRANIRPEKDGPDQGLTFDAVLQARNMTVGEVTAALSDELDLAPPEDVPGWLASTLLQQRRDVVTIAIDGLDEAAAPLELAAELRLCGEIPGVRFVVTTRPGTMRSDGHPPPSDRLISALGPSDLVDLDDTALWSTEADIRDYVGARLLDDDHPRSLTVGEQTDQIIEALTTLSGGVFLFAHLGVQLVLGRADDQSIEDWQDWLPHGSAELFGQMVDAELGRLTPPIRNTVVPMLTALAWAKGSGLPRSKVWTAIAGAFSTIPLDDDSISLTLARVPWYITEASELGQTVYRLRHDEIARYFRDRASISGDAE